MEKIQIIEIIRTGSIYPFKWGNSSEDLIKIFPNWKFRIDQLKESKCPYIEIDGIEFYFEKDFYQNLSEIIIKNITFEKNYYSEYFEIDWLNNELNFKQIYGKLNELGWKFELTKSKKLETPIILTKRNVLFGFEDLYENENKNESELMKIYIKENEYEMKNL